MWDQLVTTLIILQNYNDSLPEGYWHLCHSVAKNLLHFHGPFYSAGLAECPKRIRDATTTDLPWRTTAHSKTF